MREAFRTNVHAEEKAGLGEPAGKEEGGCVGGVGQLGVGVAAGPRGGRTLGVESVGTSGPTSVVQRLVHLGFPIP